MILQRVHAFIKHDGQLGRDDGALVERLRLFHPGLAGNAVQHPEAQQLG